MFAFVKYTRCGKLLIPKRNYSIVNNGGTLLVQKLPERNLLRISGKDASTYLQGLITNDMNHLQSGGYSLYTLFLNSKGRVLYDSIVYKTHEENTFFIECDDAGASQLKDHLLHFKVRRKINVDLLSNDFDVWAMTKDDGTCDSHEIPDYKKIRNFMTEKLPELITATDPRLTSMGLRVITPKTTNLANEIENITDLKVKTDNYYKLLRYKLGIGEGMQELPTEKCFPMEINADYMHGISFHKGCYIGQELTARTHHTGAIRKRIMPIIFSQKIHSPEPGTPIYSTEQTNKSIGKLLGVEGNNGLAQLRIEEALKAEELLVGNDKCKTHRPFWWPIEAPKTRMKIG